MVRPGFCAARASPPAGFRAAESRPGSKHPGAPDLALVFNGGPDYAAAGVFTRNQVKAAPVLWSAQVLTTGRLRAVLLNSGGANACTGPASFADTHATAEAVAATLSNWGTETGPIEVAVCSTGLIGDRLPMDRVLAGSPDRARTGRRPARQRDAARAIMTTDTVPKQVALHHGIESGENWTVGRMAKGAGMLAPSLATMLCVLTTDAVADAAALDSRAAACDRRTFDRLDVDGSSSTNDTVLLLASGASECSPIKSNSTTPCCGSAKTCARSYRPTPRGHQAGGRHGHRCPCGDDAVTARIVARDSLVKTALFGSDPNWGRVLAAVGMAPFPWIRHVSRWPSTASGVRRRCRCRRRP